MGFNSVLVGNFEKIFLGFQQDTIQSILNPNHIYGGHSLEPNDVPEILLLKKDSDDLLLSFMINIVKIYNLLWFGKKLYDISFQDHFMEVLVYQHVLLFI